MRSVATFKYLSIVQKCRVALSFLPLKLGAFSHGFRERHMEKPMISSTFLIS
ncbi:hypothetical protein ANAPC1_01416 [Anaplasma phagocytophilum]|uniref:Uncharacterized protein n=1 Tax=Anaplasma phagocytophilum TaxID=948 RepID=A0AA45UU33_ANAPH|nr:hypothetical protein ANAPC1_01416 [Anaplasma phagocytophilum]SBO31044.1 hypothetical protein ANAPC3_00388 [Anaplasma phagocytophilum]